ncbi:DUF7009 family protein [Maribacter sp. 2210JD10-5]|uniref:DUF7009 family protein n=1 Tax=Maribacter sp. 2210JD10-5 TaxID=3386272 RepID=UPI0039BCBE09
MKIRIRGNSIRFRLTKTEVETLFKTGEIEETTQIKNKRFGYRVKLVDHTVVLDASFEEDTISLFLSKSKSQGWPTNAVVGFNTIQKNEDGSTLSLLLEKDFVCMDERVEDQSDNYPNPKSA